MRVIIGVPTFKRPESLHRTLASLAEQDGCDRVEVWVIDNDPDGSAASVVEAFKTLSVRYLVEGRPGVVHVRNRLLEESAGADVLVFVDDDETACPGWLAALLEMHDQHPDDALAGPVDYVVDGQPITDPVAAAVFRRPEHEDGSTLALTGTGNSLLPLHVIRRMPSGHFDDRFSSSGGEDTDFFSRFVQAGGTIRWCSRARVVEHVPRERADRSEALRRAAKGGYVNGLLALENQSRVSVLIGAGARIAAGSFAALKRHDRNESAAALVRRQAGWGRARAALGQQYAYYGTTRQ